MTASIVQLSVSKGGVPKLPVERAQATREGLEGDHQNDRAHHGGPERALCLYSLERIKALRAEGHPISPGSAGENVTITGLDWSRLQPGVRLRLGEDVEVEVTTHTTPCKTIRESFLDGEFTRISQKLHPGDSRVYARVLREGPLSSGASVKVLDPEPPAAR